MTETRIEFRGRLGDAAKVATIGGERIAGAPVVSRLPGRDGKGGDDWCVFVSATGAAAEVLAGCRLAWCALAAVAAPVVVTVEPARELVSGREARERYKTDPGRAVEIRSPFPFVPGGSREIFRKIHGALRATVLSYGEAWRRCERWCRR